jgi:lipoprotein-anchoring transpeptidase ErfK/SrfK
VTPHAPIRRTLGAILAVAATGALLAACTSTTKGEVKDGSPVAGGSSSNSTSASTAGPPSSSATADPAVINVTGQHTNLSPAHPIQVAVKNGSLTSVSLTNPDGKKVTGAFNADKTGWSSSEALGYGKTYRLAAAAVDESGQSVTRTATYTTVSPGNLTMPYLNTVAGGSIANGATYGVGMIPVVHFDEQVTDRAAAERALQVTVDYRSPGGHHPVITGTWAWIDSQNVQWRGKDFLPTGAKVTVTAKVYGVQVGPGLYGQADQSVWFKIGAKHVSIADDATHTVKVYFNDRLQRTMATSMGQGGYTTGTGGQQIALWTMPGTYTVIGHENPAIMSSDSYGLPANSPLGYAPEKVYWSTKISTDGIYLHELTTTIWAQGHQDVSHGCLNLNTDNATWFYKTSLIGDVVIVKNVHTVDGQKSAPVQWWQGGAWTMSYSQWQSHSALAH